MKKLTLVSLLTLLFLNTNSLLAQNTKTPDMTFNAEKAFVSKDGKVTTFEGKVQMTCGKMRITSADKVIYEKETQKITVPLNNLKFFFEGEIISIPTAENIKDPNSRKLEYTLGGTTAVIK